MSRERSSWRRTASPVRTLALAATARVAHLAAEAVVGPGPVLSVLGFLTSVALIAALGWAAWRLAAVARRRFLWRVRRKLLLSYMLIGVVPIVLVAAFFVFSAFLMLFHVSAYLFRMGIDDVVDEAVVIANSAIAEVQRGPLTRAPDVLEGRRLNSMTRYPDVSLAIVPLEGGRGVLPAHVGPWSHSTAPMALPPWVGRAGFQGLVLLAPPPDQPPGLAVRAIATPGPQARWAMVVDLPVDERIADQWQMATGIDLERVAVLRSGIDDGAQEGGTVLQRAPSTTRFAFNTVTFFDFTDWERGEAGTLFLSLRVAPAEMYRRFAAVQSRFGDRTMGDIFLIVLGILGVAFLVIEAVALVMGMALARSITSAIHELFEGTRHVKAGDFGHRIRVVARDQLGELAGAFNEMTSSIQELMRQQEEKRRLEEELRIARDIQLSLLPRGTLGFPGLAISTVCVPAMEVGGDYFDFFRIDEWRVGFLIADVAGKGTFAALYMAELKGLMLSLSRIHPSPKRLLVEVNRILSHTLDGRSFISMTYAVMDLGSGRLEYARAGHTPLIHVTGQHEARV
ncbi:MAG: PP2C family protein-serine/threonine phosphatase, partial [Vicinamibacterales bacterium]